MQFFAYLKDSFREARSGWVLQAMLVLSALMVLFVGSVSFRPISLKETLDGNLDLSNSLSKSNAGMGFVTFHIENYEQTNLVEPWKADYAFDWVVRTPSAEDLKKATDIRGLPTSRARVERDLGKMTFLKDLKVASGPDGAVPGERRFRVTAATRATDAASWPQKATFLFFFEGPSFLAMPMRTATYLMQKYLISGAGAWIILFISVVISAAFIPNLLQKGAVDVAVSKPISRPLLLVYKYVGGLTFTGLLTIFTVGGAWLVMGLRTGLWNWYFLLMVPLLLFYFAIVYAVSVLFAVLTRNTIVAILATLLAWGLFFGIGKLNNDILNRYDAVEKIKKEDAKLKPGEQPDPDEILNRADPDRPVWWVIPKSVWPVCQLVHAVTPRTYQLDDRLDDLIAQGVLTDTERKDEDLKEDDPRGTWAEIFGVSGAFIAVMLGLACWRFQTRDT